MQQIIDKINSMIASETSPNMSSESISYVAGLSDALEAIIKGMNDKPVVNRYYFVIMFKEDNKKYPYIDHMRCYKISEKLNSSYCFTKSDIKVRPTPDLVLHSESGLTRRVFETREDAEFGIACFWS